MSRSDLASRRLIFIFVLVVAVHIIGFTFGGYYFWGVGIWHGLPTWVFAAAVCLVFISLSLAQKTYWVEVIAHNVLSDKRIPPPRTIARFAVNFLVLAAVSFMAYILRSRSLLYGDGYAAVESTTRTWNDLFQSAHEWLKPLSVALYKISYDLSHTVFGLDHTTTFAICSSVGGAIGWMGILRLVRAIAHDPTERFFLLVSVFTSGAILIFIGHVEFYVWSVASLIWFLAFAHESTATGPGRGLYVTAVVTVLLNVMLLPAVAAVVLLTHRDDVPLFLRRLLRPAPILICAIAASGLLAFFFQWFNLSYGIVPVIPNEQNRYWLLSLDHLSDAANALIFACPLILYLGLFTGVRSTLGSYQFLFVSSVLIWLVSFWIDVDAGAARDWDLLSQYGIPLALFCALAMLSVTRRYGTGRFVLPMATLAAFLIIPYLCEKLDRERMVERLNSVIMDDPHYQASYMEGSRTISWGALLHNEEGRPELAEPYFRRRFAADSNASLVAGHLGILYMEMKRYDSAETYLKRAFRRDSANDVLRVQLSNALLFQSKWEELAPLLLRYPSTDSLYVSVLHTCAKELFAAGDIARAVPCYLKLDTLRSTSIYYKLALALSYARTGQEESALHYIAEADSLSSDSMRCQLLTVSLKDLNAYNCSGVAQRLLPRYLEVCPIPDSELIRAIATDVKH